MVELINLLKRKYDYEIRLACSELEKKLDNCLLEFNNDKFVCDINLKNFNKCIKDFDTDFKKTHRLLNSIKTDNLPE